MFDAVDVKDRREQPSHGYRAVHVVAEVGDKPIEIQVRTRLQHAWAELSERISDVFDPEIKYGRGPDFARSALTRLSELAGVIESDQEQILAAIGATPSEELSPSLRQAIAAFERNVTVREDEVRLVLDEFWKAARRERPDVVLD